MEFLKKFRKILKVLHRKFICCFMYINCPTYMEMMVKYLKKNGMRIDGFPNYICNDVHFDGKDYSKIYLGNNITISREVLFLTHDYSMYTVFAQGNSGMTIPNADILKLQNDKDKLLILREIVVEENCFIGARATLLPGTHIGKNSIIGAGAVVKGNIPAESIVVGNPSRVIGTTSEWLNNKAQQIVERGELL